MCVCIGHEEKEYGRFSAESTEEKREQEQSGDTEEQGKRCPCSTLSVDFL